MAPHNCADDFLWETSLSIIECRSVSVLQCAVCSREGQSLKLPLQSREDFGGNHTGAREIDHAGRSLLLSAQTRDPLMLLAPPLNNFSSSCGRRRDARGGVPIDEAIDCLTRFKMPNCSAYQLHGRYACPIS